ncbi:hypothetical protein AYI69_g8909 [Smittium culicis]|uniref:PXA domain-containing protein n=1 Tax=Smittium culicis TaxID=133412 RepID=A0A1R1XGC1_9FUNG|nr:hypothetical protein AYI69_g8909 [Smittium culicis]
MNSIAPKNNNIDDSKAKVFRFCKTSNKISCEIEQIDWFNYVSTDIPLIVNTYLKDLRDCENRLDTIYSGKCNSIEELYQKRYPHSAMLVAAESELCYLRHLSSEILQVLLPVNIIKDEVTAHLLREIISCVVLRTIVDLGSDPNTFNSAIITSLKNYSKNQYFFNLDMDKYFSTPNEDLENQETPGIITVQKMVSEALESDIKSNSYLYDDKDKNFNKPMSKNKFTPDPIFSKKLMFSDANSLYCKSEEDQDNLKSSMGDVKNSSINNRPKTKLNKLISKELKSGRKRSHVRSKSEYTGIKYAKLNEGNKGFDSYYSPKLKDSNKNTTLPIEKSLLAVGSSKKKATNKTSCA